MSHFSRFVLGLIFDPTVTAGPPPGGLASLYLAKGTLSKSLDQVSYTMNVCVCVRVCVGGVLALALGLLGGYPDPNAELQPPRDEDSSAWAWLGTSAPLQPVSSANSKRARR